MLSDEDFGSLPVSNVGLAYGRTRRWHYDAGIGAANNALDAGYRIYLVQRRRPDTFLTAIMIAFL
jgi:hypothetical protein